MPDDSSAHWQAVYRRNPPTAVSWFEPIPRRSLDLILATGLEPDDPVLDVGGGASTLADHLLDRGFTDLTVLDIAPAALEAAKSRLGARADRVTWVAGDVLSFRPARRYALWHDRAVLHFLTEASSRDRYLDVLRSALRPAGHAVLATFGPEGPTRCSGLPVHRYSADEVDALLGPGFLRRESLLETHRTPTGTEQQFLYGRWQAVSNEALG